MSNEDSQNPADVGEMRVVDCLFGSDAKLPIKERPNTKPKALHVQNLTLQFISETGSTYGPRVYDRSLHTQQCIRRMNRPKTKRTRARPIKVKPIGPLSWAVKTDSCHETSYPGRKRPPIRRSKHSISRNILKSPDGCNVEPSRRTSVSSTVTESSESTAKSQSQPQSSNSFPDESQLVPVRLNPISIVGQGSRDHLSSYPIACTDFDHGVIDHYQKWKFIYGYPDQARASPFSSYLHDCMFDAAAFHLLLAQSAYNLAALKGQSPPKQAIAHKIAGISIVNARLSDPNLAVCDGNIMAATTMVSIENRFGDVHAAAIHLKGLKTMIELRGGLPGLSFREQRRTLFRVFSYPARSAHVKLGDVRKNSGYILQTPTYVTAFATTQSPYEEYDECEEFIARIHAYTSFSLSRHSIDGASLFSPALQSLVKPYFHPSTPLYRILSSPHPHIYPEAHLVKDSALFACLLILHATLYSLRGSPLGTLQYLDKVSSDLKENGLVPTSKGSIEFLLWTLLTDSSAQNLKGFDLDLGLADCATIRKGEDGSGKSEILLLVLRLFTTARKLKPEGWARVKETLVAGLVGDLGRVVRATLSWTEEGLRGEILGCG